MTKVAVVILNYNGEKLLRQFLPSVLEHTPFAEIIVADNNSTDQSILLLKTDFPTVRIIALDKNYGFCGGYNRALKQVDAHYFVLLNSDIEVTANWLEPMSELLDNNSAIAAVQPKILSYHTRTKFEYAGAAGGFIDSLGYPFCRGRIFTHVEEDRGQYDDEREIFWATGACMMIRSDVYHKLDGFDEDFFAHMEEIDLCWKINRTKSKVYYCGRSKIYHLGAGTLGYENPQKTYLNFRNGLFLISKHFNNTELVLKLPVRISLDWLAALIFLLRGQSKNCLAVLRAHLDFVNMFKKTIDKRKVIHTVYPHYSAKNILKGLIIIRYYIFSKKTFSNPK
jgi:GT2 family glycosyltransferase